jgi:hypothetical protein
LRAGSDERHRDQCGDRGNLVTCAQWRGVRFVASRLAMPGTSLLAMTGSSRLAMPGTSLLAMTGSSRLAMPGTSLLAMTGSSPGAMTGCSPGAMTGCSPGVMTVVGR